MKKYTLLFLFVLLANVCFAQAPDTLECDAPEMDTTELESIPWFGNNDYLENFLDSIGYPAAGPQYRIIGPDRVRYHVPIKFWVYRNSAGVGGPNQQQLQNYIDNLNRFYNVVNNTLIGFYMKCEVGFIDDDDHLEVGDSEAWGLIQSHKEAGCINIHITNDLPGALGVFYRARFFGIDGIFLNASTYTRPEFASTIAQEVGHYFELLHTHEYSDKGKCRKEAIDRNRTWPTFNICFSSLRSNKVCESTGDLLRDTPADHDLSFNNSCNYIITGQTDPWGDHYETPPAGSLPPDTRNILSYNGLRSCRDVFSRLQIAVMLYSIERGKSRGNRSEWKDMRAEYDEYEPDNNSLNARDIQFGQIQERNFHQQYEGNGFWSQCDVDWARFVATCSGTFDVQTSSIIGRTNANTRLTIFDAGAVNQLAQNDDISPSNQFSSITLNLVAGQTYFFRIENMTANVTGYYNLNVAEAFTINGDNTFCGTSNNYSITNLPAGANVLWQTLPQGIATPNTPNAQQTTLTRNNDGVITLTATITNACGNTAVTVTKDNINIGFPFTDTNTFLSAEDINITVTHPSEFIVNAYRWYKDGVFFRQTTAPMLKTTLAYQCHDWSVSFVTACGESPETLPISVGCGVGMMMLSVSPNPTTGNIKVALFEKGKPEKKMGIKQIKIVDKSGMIKAQYNYGAGEQNPTLNTSELTPDVYTIIAFDGKKWTASKFIKN